ncbi:hypothetical protein PG994_012549 [Apiospora phragmitis]|uniref:Uncharacterized protein n=1 Tax=Apiospora phragmitis TaxID=2905665 RepID=A0ABR1TVY6_9PEZI
MTFLVKVGETHMKNGDPVGPDQGIGIHVLLWVRQEAEGASFQAEMAQLSDDFKRPGKVLKEDGREETDGFDAFIQIINTDEPPSYTIDRVAPGTRVTTTTGTHEYVAYIPEGGPGGAN